MPQDQPFDILIIDDDPTIFDLLSRISQQLFPEASFQVITSPQETIEYLKSQSTTRPRLILLDIDLQQSVNGLALLPQLNKHFYGQTPIIIFSVTALEPDVQQAYDTGAVAYTQKPDDLQGWRDYVLKLRKYWYETTRLPPSAQPPIQLLKQA